MRARPQSALTLDPEAPHVEVLTPPGVDGLTKAVRQLGCEDDVS